MNWHPEKPYNDLPLLPPSVELETKTVLKRCVTARSALAELKRAAHLIPNQAMLINTLPMLEAKASSEIENVVTTADKLFQFADSSTAKADPATKEASRYGTALREGSQTLAKRPINTNMAEAIASQVKGIDMTVRKLPGTALMNEATGRIITTPPEGEKLLRDLLANWERFLNDSPELDPLVRMAVMHYQFEAIHPFADGNGRTGRILNSLYLVQEGLLQQPILYLSRYILATRERYYGGLLAVTRDQAWEPWLLYMLEGVETMATWTMRKVLAIHDLADEIARHVRERLPKIYSRELIDVIFAQPYCRIHNLVAAGIAKRQTASAYLDQLTAMGVLAARQAGREKLLVNPRLLQLLTQEDDETEPGK